jgi:hypothetical protein
VKQDEGEEEKPGMEEEDVLPETAATLCHIIGFIGATIFAFLFVFVLGLLASFCCALSFRRRCAGRWQSTRYSPGPGPLEPSPQFRRPPHGPIQESSPIRLPKPPRVVGARPSSKSAWARAPARRAGSPFRNNVPKNYGNATGIVPH